MIEIGLPDAPPVDGLRFRRYGGVEDHPAMHRVATAAREADGVEEVSTLEQMNINYANLVNCEPQRDILLAEVDGDLVAYCRVFWQDLVDGGRTYECFGFIHPAWRQGCGHRSRHHRDPLCGGSAAVRRRSGFGRTRSGSTAIGNCQRLRLRGYRR